MGANFGVGMSLGQGLVGLFGNSGSVDTDMSIDPMNGPMGMYQQSVDSEANMIEEQGRLSLQESEARADQIAQQAHDFREEQAVGFSNSGVLISGTPTEVLNRTVSEATKEINAEMRQGVALHGQAYQRAAITRNQGRAALLGSQMEYNTRKAQTRIAAIEANSDSKLGTALLGLGSALGNYNPSKPGTGFSLFSKKPQIRGGNQYNGGVVLKGGINGV